METSVRVRSLFTAEERKDFEYNLHVCDGNALEALEDTIRAIGFRAFLSCGIELDKWWEAPTKERIAELAFDAADEVYSGRVVSLDDFRTDVLALLPFYREDEKRYWQGEWKGRRTKARKAADKALRSVRVYGY